MIIQSFDNVKGLQTKVWRECLCTEARNEMLSVPEVTLISLRLTVFVAPVEVLLT